MARKKRKITAAHLRALQAGRKRYQREQRAKNPKRRRKASKSRNPVHKRKAHRRRHPTYARGWWVMRSADGKCRIGFGSHPEALKKGQEIADRTGVGLDLGGPFNTRAAAKAACG